MTKVSFEKNDKASLSAAEVAVAKRDYHDVYHVKLQIRDFDPENPEYKECWLRPPGRVELANARMQSKGNSLAFDEILAKSCWLAGDKDIVNDDYYFIGLSTFIDKVINFADGELVKL